MLPNLIRTKTSSLSEFRNRRLIFVRLYHVARSSGWRRARAAKVLSQQNKALSGVWLLSNNICSSGIMGARAGLYSSWFGNSALLFLPNFLLLRLLGFFFSFPHTSNFVWCLTSNSTKFSSFNPYSLLTSNDFCSLLTPECHNLFLKIKKYNSMDTKFCLPHELPYTQKPNNSPLILLICSETPKLFYYSIFRASNQNQSWFI